MPFLPGALRGRKLKGNIPVVFIDPGLCLLLFTQIYRQTESTMNKIKMPTRLPVLFFSFGLRVIPSDYLFDEDPVFVGQIQIVAAYMHHRVS